MIGAAAVVPAVLILWLVVATDARPEPPAIVWGAFLLGAASIFLLRYLPMPLEALVGPVNNPWVALGLRAIDIAVSEETAKILVIGLVALRHRSFEDPMDMVIYGAAVGLGFAAYENLFYLVRHYEDWQMLAVVRSFLTVPFHGAMGVIAGAYLAIARYGGALGAHRRSAMVRARLVAAIWIVPVVLHASFDFPLLALRNNLADGVLGRAALQASGLFNGFGSIALAAYLIWRINIQHRPLIEKSRPPTVALRAVWALLMVGGSAAFVGAVVVQSQLHRSFIDNTKPQRRRPRDWHCPRLCRWGDILVGPQVSDALHSGGCWHGPAPNRQKIAATNCLGLCRR